MCHAQCGGGLRQPGVCLPQRGLRVGHPRRCHKTPGGQLLLARQVVLRQGHSGLRLPDLCLGDGQFVGTAAFGGVSGLGLGSVLQGAGLQLRVALGFIVQCEQQGIFFDLLAGLDRQCVKSTGDGRGHVQVVAFGVTGPGWRGLVATGGQQSGGQREQQPG